MERINRALLKGGRGGEGTWPGGGDPDARDPLEKRRGKGSHARTGALHLVAADGGEKRSCTCTCTAYGAGIVERYR